MSKITLDGINEHLKSVSRLVATDDVTVEVKGLLDNSIAMLESLLSLMDKSPKKADAFTPDLDKFPLSKYFQVVDKLGKKVDAKPLLKEGESVNDFFKEFLKYLTCQRGCHWMIDTETLGLSVNSTVVQLAMVPFSPISGGLFTVTFRGMQGISIVHNANLEVSNQGREVDEDTLKWWKKSNTANLHLLTQGTLPLFMELYYLKLFLNKDSQVWANSPTFDLALIKNCYEMFGESTPIHFRNEWDVRTASKMAGLSKVALDKMYPESDKYWGHPEGLAHNALIDCLTQVYQVQLAYTMLGIIIKKQFKEEDKS